MGQTRVRRGCPRSTRYMYGSGHFDLGSSVERGNLSKMPPEQARLWLDELDAKNYDSQITARFFYAAATNDVFCWIPAVTATFADIRARKNLVFSPNTSHIMLIPGCSRPKDSPEVPHGTPWMAEEVDYFQYLSKGEGHPFPRVERDGETILSGGAQQITFQVKVAVGKTEGSVYYEINGLPIV